MFFLDQQPLFQAWAMYDFCNFSKHASAYFLAPLLYANEWVTLSTLSMGTQCANGKCLIMHEL